MPDRELLRVTNFRGLNTRVNKFLLPDGAAQRAINFVFDEEGALAVIEGFRKWNATSLGATPIQGGIRFYRTGSTPQFVVVHGGNVYVGDDVAQSFTQIYTGLDSTAATHLLPYRDLVFILNGVDRPRKYNPAATPQVSLMGLDAPTAAPTAADSGTAGNLNGTYTWKVTFVSPTMESNGSPASNTLTVTNKQVTLTNIPVSSDPQVTARRIYRTLAGGTIYKFVGQIPDNTTTTFTDNVADSALGADIPIDKDPPPAGKIAEVFKNRVWMAGVPGFPRRLFFSEYFEPEAWPPTFYVDLPLDQGDEITGLKVLGEVLVVYGHNRPLVILGESPFDFVVRRTFANTGAESNRAIVAVENTHIFLSRFGIYAFDGAIARLLTDDITPTFRDLDSTKFHQAAAVYNDPKKRVHFALYIPEFAALNETTNTGELLYDLRTGSWTMSTKKIGFYIPATGPGDKSELYFTSPSTGFLYKTDPDAITFDGAGFSAIWKSKGFAPRSIDIPKQWRYFFAFLLQGDATALFTLILDEGATAIYSFNQNIAALAPARYGSAVYGSSKYNPPQAITRIEKSLPRELISRTLEYEIEIQVPSTALSGPVKIVAVETLYTPIPNFRLRGGNTIIA